MHQNGSKYFRYDYRFNGKRKTLPLGVYPITTLKEARAKRDTAKRQLDDGIDPCLERKIKKLVVLENTFKAIALEWYEKNAATKSESHKKRILRLFNRDLFPWLGDKPIHEIKTSELLMVLKRIDDLNLTETVHRTLQTSGQIFRYAMASGKTETDITLALKGALSPT